MKSVRHTICNALAAALMLASGAALAQGAQKACAPDIEKFCAGMSQGEGKLSQCLRSHKQELSPACQQGMAQMATMMKDVKQACEDDLHKYCAGTKPDGARACLRANFRELSQPCKHELLEARKAKGK